MVYIILGKGFEPVEAITPCDILRRGGVDVKLAGIGGKTVEAAHGVTVAADCTVEEIDQNALEMIVLPGGLGGVESILGLPGGAGRGEARVGRRQICRGHLRGADGAGQARHHGGPQGDLLSRLRGRRCPGTEYTPVQAQQDGKLITGQAPARRSRSG